MENEIIDEGIKAEVAAYNELWDFFYSEHGLTLLHSELDDIIYAVCKFKELLNNTNTNT